MTTEPKELSLSPPIVGDAEAQALKEVIQSGWITMGETVQRFEQAFATLHGMNDAVAVSSATAGLHLSLAALGVGEGDEVIVPSLTFVATANAALYTGATPVLADIEAVDRPHISMEDARAKLTPRTKAIVLVHYGGWLCPMDRWREFADEHGLYLVEDASHAPGLPGVGQHGDAAVFSFYGNKNMTTAEGGMVLARDPDILGRVRRLRSHGMTSLTLDRHKGHAFSYDVTDLGFNYRMDELRAALGLVQLEQLEGWNRKRARLLERYREAFAHADGGVTLPFDPREPTTAHVCPALLPTGTDREALMQTLRGQGIHTSIHYPPIHAFSYYRSRLGEQRLEHTEAFSGRELSLPLHPGLAARDIDYVVDAVTAVTRKHGVT